MSARTVWRIRLDGKHWIVELSHNTADGSGSITVDNSLRQCFGARLAPTSSAYAFEIAGRKCIVRIQLITEQWYRYECEVNGTVLVAASDRSAPAVTLLRPSDIPSAPGDDLLRPAATGSTTPTNELLLPQFDSSES